MNTDMDYIKFLGIFWHQPHILTMGKVYRNVANIQGISFAKRIEEKDGVLSEIFNEWVFCALYYTTVKYLCHQPHIFTLKEIYRNVAYI